MLFLRLARRNKTYGQSVRTSTYGGTRWTLSLPSFTRPLSLVSLSLSEHGSLRLLSFLSERGRLLRAQSSSGSPGKAAATSPARARAGSGWGRSGTARWSGAERRGWADAAGGGLPGGSSARGAAARSSGLAGGGGDLPGHSPPAAAPSSPGRGVFFFFFISFSFDFWMQKFLFQFFSILDAKIFLQIFSFFS